MRQSSAPPAPISRLHDGIIEQEGDLFVTAASVVLYEGPRVPVGDMERHPRQTNIVRPFSEFVAFCVEFLRNIHARFQIIVRRAATIGRVHARFVVAVAVDV